MSKASEYSKRKSGENTAVVAPTAVNVGAAAVKTKNKAQVYSEKKRITGNTVLSRKESLAARQEPTASAKDIVNYQKLTLQEKRMTEQERKEQEQAKQTQYWYDYDVDAAQKELDALEYEPAPFISADWWKGVAEEFATAGKNTERSNPRAEQEKQARISQLSQEINIAKKYQQAKQYYDLTQSEDFETLSKDTRYKGTNEYDAVFGRDPGGVENLDKKKQEQYYALVDEYGEDSKEAEQFLLLEVGNGVNPIAKNMQEITDEEKSLYNYILIKQGKDAAQAYIDYLQDSFNERHAASTYENLQKNREKYGGTYAALDNIADVGYSFGTGIQSGVQGLAKVFIDEAKPLSDSEYLQSMMREDAGFIKGIAMDSASSIGNMLPSIGLSLIHPVVGKVAFGLSAGGNAKQEALRQGFTAKQATNYGVLVGASEVLIENILGGIPGISSGNLGKATSEGVGKIGKVLYKFAPWAEKLLRTAGSLVGDAAGEGFEEWVQNGLDGVLRNICFGENNEWKPFSEEALYDALVGSITSFAMNAPNVGSTYTAEYNKTIANRVLVGSQSFKSETVEKARQNLAEKVNEGDFDQSDIDAVKEAATQEIIEMAREDLQKADLESMFDDNSTSTDLSASVPSAQEQVEDDPVDAVRSHFSEEGRAYFDLAMKDATEENAQSIADAFEMQYLRGFIGNEYKADSTAISNAMQEAAYKAGADAKKSLGTVSISEGVTVSDEFRATLARVAKDLHTHITYGGTAPTRNGFSERGYSTKYGELHIYADAKVKGAKGTTLYGERAAAVIIAGHELTHRLQQLAPSEYTAFRDLAVQARGGDDAVAKYAEKYHLSPADAMDEIAANYAMEKLFFDEKTIKAVTKKHSGLAQAIRNILQRIKEKLGIASSDLDNAIRLWNDAYNASRRNAKNPQVHDDIAQKKNADSDTGEGVKYSLSKTKIENLKNTIYSLGKKGIVLNADGKRIKVFTDIYTVNKNIHSKKGRSDKEVNARIKAIPEFESILKKSKYEWTDTEMRDTEKDAKKGVKAMVHFSAEYGDYTLDILFRDKGERQYLYEVKFMYKKSSQQSERAKASSSAPDGDVENEYNIAYKNSVVKQKQLEIINATNPAPDTYHTWVRSVDDILTFDEALQSDEYADYDTFAPDYTRAMADAAIESGEITVYSSYPIKNGVFVTPSAMEAQSYSGNGKIYAKTIKLEEVAWIDITQGQYAKVDYAVEKNDAKKSLSGSEELDAELEAAMVEKRGDAYAVADELVSAEEQARKDGRRYTMSLDTFEQVVREYASDIKSERKEAIFTNRLYNAAVELAAAYTTRGKAKAEHYKSAYLGMQDAARLLESDNAAVEERAIELTLAMLEAGFEGAPSTQAARDVFMSTKQARMDMALSKGYRGALTDAVKLADSRKQEQYEEKIEQLKIDKQALRDKAARIRGEAQKDYRKKYTKWKAEYSESDTVQKRRARIEKNMTALYKWATKPDKKGHSIPQEGRAAILEMLSRVNMQKDGKGQAPSLHDIQWGERLANVAAALDSRTNADTPDVTDEFIPVGVILRLKENAAAIGNANVYEMRGDALRALDESLCILKTLITKANELHVEGRTVELDTSAEGEIVRLSTTPKSKTRGITYDMMDSFTYVEEVGGLVGNMVKNLRSRFDVFIDAAADVRNFAERQLDAKKVREWRKNVREVRLGGQNVYMTDAQIMSLYLLSKREQARGHIYGDGIKINRKDVQTAIGNRTINEVREKLPGAQENAVQKWIGDTKDLSMENIKAEDVETAIALLSKEQIAAADAVQRFMADVLGGMGNEVSMRMYGYFAFTEENYFPIKTVKESNKTTASTDNVDNIFSIMNSGMTKRTVEHAKNPLMIEDMFSVFTQHASEMLNYYAYAEAVSDCMRVYNFKPEKGGKTLAEALSATYQGANDFYLNQIRALNAQKAFKGSNLDGILGKLAGQSKAAAVGMNLRVVFQQPAAIARAMALVNPKYCYAMGKKVSKETVQKYCPIARWKSWGFYELDIGHDLDTLFFGNRTKYQAIKDKQMWLAGEADEITWSALWNICYAETKDTRKDLQVDSEEFLQAVGKRLSQIVDETQVVDSPFHRTQAARSQKDMTKAAMSFMSEPVKSLNLLYRAKKRGKKQVARALAAVEVSQVIAAAGAALIDALRDDDDEENWLEKYKSALGGNLLDNINPLSWVPIVGDDLSGWSYGILFGTVDKIFGTEWSKMLPKQYSSSRYEMQAIESVDDTISTLTDEDKGWYDKMYASSKTLALFTGIGWHNLFRDVVGSVVNLANGVSPKGAYKKALTVGDTATVQKNYKAFFDAKCEELAQKKLGVPYSELTGALKTQIEKSAKSSIKSTTRSLFKDDYIKAWRDSDTEAITGIRRTLLATSLYDEKGMQELFLSFKKSYYKTEYQKASEKKKNELVKEAISKGVFKSKDEALKYFAS